MARKAKVTGLTSASEVRNYFRNTKGATEALSEKAQASVRPQDEGKTLRGRLHPEAIAAFNEANPSTPYEFGAGVAKTVTVKGVKFVKGGKNGAVRRPEVTLTVPEAREHLSQAGIEVGKRGRISATQAENLGAMLVL